MRSEGERVPADAILGVSALLIGAAAAALIAVFSGRVPAGALARQTAPPRVAARRPVAVPSAVARAAAVPNVTTAAAGVTAPHGYRVERLRPIAVDEFDVDGEGHVAVRTGATVRDLADGAALSEAVKSFAFAAGELDLITASGELGYLDASGVKTVGPVPFEAARLRAGDDGADLFFLRDQPPYTLGAMDASGTVRALAALPAPVDAVAGTAAHHVFSIGPDLYAQAGSEEPQLVLHLPERDQLIVGLAMPNAETLYFATHRGVYAVRGSLAMPLMLGFGGPLRVAGKTLTVLNEGDRTLYRLVAPA